MVEVLTALYLNHIIFVDEGKRKYPEVNYSMSLTIWKDPEKTCESVSDASGVGIGIVREILNFIVVRPRDSGYFVKAQARFTPMLIEVAEGHWVCPVSSIFKNPFHGIRMLAEFHSPKLQAAFSEHREDWMAGELYDLFQGPQFERLRHPVKLTRSGVVVTDIDAAIYDHVSGDLVLFQLN